MSEAYSDLPFPLRGLDLSTGFADQRMGSCCEGDNVLGAETYTDRSRGGSRPGLTRFINELLPLGAASGSTIQHLNVVVRGAVGGLPDLPDDFDFNDPDWEDDWSSDGPPRSWTTGPLVIGWDNQPIPGSGGGGGGRNPGPQKKRKKGSGRPPSPGRIQSYPSNGVYKLYTCIGQVNINAPGHPLHNTNPSFNGCACVSLIYLALAGAPTSCLQFKNWRLRKWYYFNENNIPQNGTWTLISQSVTGPVRDCNSADYVPDFPWPTSSATPCPQITGSPSDGEDGWEEENGEHP